MNLTVKSTLIFAAIYIVIEMAILFFDLHQTNYGFVAAMGVNVLCLLLAVGSSIIIHFNREKQNGLSVMADLKTGLKASVLYALTIALFVFSYYKWINPTYPKQRLEMHKAMIANASTDAQIEQMIKEDPARFEGQTVEDVKENALDNASYILNDTGKVFPITLLALLVLGIFYTFLITGFNRLILSKF